MTLHDSEQKGFRLTGWLLMAGAWGVLIPYILLSIHFEYPQILREDPLVILSKFQAGGVPLIMTWLAFAVLGLPLLVAYVMLGKKLEGKWAPARWLTTFGVISMVAQMAGLLRWVFVVPVLARHLPAGDPATEQALRIAFEVQHQAGGVLLGEFVGQFFTVVWTIGMAWGLWKQGLIPGWLMWVGLIGAGIYGLGQGELFATVIPGLAHISWAGFAGSSLWLIWLMLLGGRWVWLPGKVADAT